MQSNQQNILAVLPESIGGRLTTQSIIDGFLQNGYSVTTYDALFDDNLKHLLENEYDLIVGYDYSALKIKINNNLKCPVINYFSDEIRSKTSGADWKKYVKYLANDDCYTFYWDRVMTKQENLKNLFYLNHFVNFGTYKDMNISPEYDVMFAGRLDTQYRLNFFEEFMVKKPQLKFAWYAIDKHFKDALNRTKYPELLKKVYRGFIDNESSMARAINNAKILFNMNSQGVSSLNYRTIQAVACKRLMISDKREELDIFEGNMPYYENLSDLINKTEKYLNNKVQYKQITDNCYTIAKQKCNAKISVRYMMSKINLGRS